jgi:hypothetical protein
MAGKSHRKKGGRKAAQKKAAKKGASKNDGIDSDLPTSNPRASQLASKGRARVARARTAEKEQRRLHGVSKYRWSHHVHTSPEKPLRAKKNALHDLCVRSFRVTCSELPLFLDPTRPKLCACALGLHCVRKGFEPDNWHSVVWQMECSKNTEPHLAIALINSTKQAEA